VYNVIEFIVDLVLVFVIKEKREQTTKC